MLECRLSQSLEVAAALRHRIQIVDVKVAEDVLQHMVVQHRHR